MRTKRFFFRFNGESFALLSSSDEELELDTLCGGSLFSFASISSSDESKKEAWRRFFFFLPLLLPGERGRFWALDTGVASLLLPGVFERDVIGLELRLRLLLLLRSLLLE